MTNTQKAIALIVLLLVLIWVVFYVGSLLDIGGDDSHWYDIPFILTSVASTVVVVALGLGFIE